jgi:hypothetical protein
MVQGEDDFQRLRSIKGHLKKEQETFLIVDIGNQIT